jgi:hypothetical protein
MRLEGERGKVEGERERGTKTYLVLQEKRY